MPDQDLIQRILDGTAISLADLVQTDDDGRNTGWHKIAVEGEWEGHVMGAFTLDGQMFDQMVTHFKTREIDTVVDFEHDSISFFGDSTSPAAGWITELQHRTNDDQSELWMRSEWTERAAGMIRAKEKRFLSPTIFFNTTDRKSGKMKGASLHSVALTNTPFLTELPEVRLNSLKAALLKGAPKKEGSPMPKELEALRKAFGLADDADMDAITAKAVQLTGNGAMLSEMAGRLELAEGFTQDQAIARIVELQNPASAANEVVALNAKVKALETENANTRALSLVTEGQNDGKVTALNEEWAKAYALKDPEGFKVWMSTAQPIVNTGTPAIPPAGGSGAGTVLTDGHKQVCRAFGLKQEVLQTFLNDEGQVN